MERFIKNNFCEIIDASSQMWHERKGFDFANNRRTMKSHLNAINREIERIKKNIELIESQEIPYLNECINFTPNK